VGALGEVARPDAGRLLLRDRLRREPRRLAGLATVQQRDPQPHQLLQPRRELRRPGRLLGVAVPRVVEGQVLLEELRVGVERAGDAARGPVPLVGAVVHLLEEAVHLGFFGQRDPCHLVLQFQTAVGYDGTRFPFFTTRSCVEGSHIGASSWRSISASIGVAGLSPSSQPERLSGRGLEPLSGWRATFSPSSSNIARSSAGSAPRVVRKLPIITPFRPALTARPWSSPRFSTRPPQRRKRAPGMIRRKIAIHLTTSIGSITSRSPNLVPSLGISRLIGTLVGLISASSKAISTRCSSVSPRFRIPPTQVSRPASLTARIVRRRPS